MSSKANLLLASLILFCGTWICVLDGPVDAANCEQTDPFPNCITTGILDCDGVSRCNLKTWCGGPANLLTDSPLDECYSKVEHICGGDTCVASALPNVCCRTRIYNWKIDVPYTCPSPGADCVPGNYTLHSANKSYNLFCTPCTNP